MIQNFLLFLLPRLGVDFLAGWSQFSLKDFSSEVSGPAHLTDLPKHHSIKDLQML